MKEEELRYPKCPCVPTCPWRDATCHGSCWIYGLWKDKMEVFNKQKRLQAERFDISDSKRKYLAQEAVKRKRRKP